MKKFLPALVILGLLFASFASAFILVIFTDNFNFYNDGDLNEQGFWTGHINYDVQGVTVQEGAKAVSVTRTAGDVIIEKTGDLLNDGKFNFYARLAQTTSYLYLHLTEDGNTRIIVGFRADGSLNYQDEVGWVKIQDYVANHWYNIQVEWRSVDHKARYKIDGGEWTDWDLTYSVWTNGVDTFKSQVTAVNGTFYLDNFYTELLPSDIFLDNIFFAFWGTLGVYLLASFSVVFFYSIFLALYYLIIKR